jgi:DNA polymerase-3 subunit gamma/tau
MAPPVAMPASAPAPAPVAAPAPAAAPSGPISPARAAINAALEAARAASKPGARGYGGNAPPAPAAGAAAEPAATPQMMAPAAPPQPQAPSAAYTPPAPSGGAPVQAAAPSRPAPWEDMPPGATMGGDAQAAVLEAPVRQVAQPVQQAPAPAAAPQYAAPAARPAPQQADDEDDLPPWVTEFSDDSAVAPSAPAQQGYAPAAQGQPQAPSASSYGQPAASQGPAAGEVPAFVAPARAAPAPAKAPYAYVITPVPELDWDGNWPAVAAALPLRGVAQQLAMQAELIECTFDGNAAVFKVRVPIETWRTPGNVEKLTVALAERFGRAVRVDTELGAVWYTASAEAQAHRAACQRAAEETIANDPFVNSMIREFDAWVVPGSIVPPPAASAAAPN